MPPVGCVPSQRTLAGGLARDCDPARNHAAQLYNSRLKEEVVLLQKELACQRIGYVDIYDVLQDMITNPCKYGAYLSCCPGPGRAGAGGPAAPPPPPPPPPRPEI
jgi:hypothetical protein